MICRVGFLGDAKSIYEMLSVHDVLDADDDQVRVTGYHNIYINHLS